jgi:hypothetical protein
MTFEEAWAVASRVNGPLGVGEAKELWRTTQSASGEIVDIGCGTRICLLLAATGPITSAVPFDEFDEPTYTIWRDQIVNSGHAKNIFVIKKDDKAYHSWEMPVGILLLGRWNEQQLQGWKIHLVTGAAIAIFNFSGNIPEDFKKENKVGSVTTLRYHPKVAG